ncbi:MAG: acyloxyacyl hydrolase [Burkholderiales bacterium]
MGRRSECEVGVRLVHFSNAGIAQPNDGITFWTLRLAYRLIGKGDL